MAEKIINSKDRRSVEQDVGRTHKVNSIIRCKLINNKDTLISNKETNNKLGCMLKPAVKECNIYNVSKKIADNNKKDITARHNFSQTIVNDINFSSFFVISYLAKAQNRGIKSVLCYSKLNNNKINNSSKIFKHTFDYQDFSINSNKLLLTLILAIMFFYLVFSIPFAKAAPAFCFGAAFILGGQNKNE